MVYTQLATFRPMQQCQFGLNWGYRVQRFNDDHKHEVEALIPALKQSADTQTPISAEDKETLGNILSDAGNSLLIGSRKTCFHRLLNPTINSWNDKLLKKLGDVLIENNGIDLLIDCFKHFDEHGKF